MRNGVPSFVVITASLIAIAAACSNPSGPEPGDAARAFPNTPGSRWTYAVYHTHTRLRDTIAVSIVGTAPLGDRATASIWEYRSRFQTDTEYVAYAGDTVNTYVRDSAGFHLSNRYLFPLATGRRWSDAFESDTSVVRGEEMISVPAGAFAHATRVDRSYPRRSTLPWINTWFVADTGIVKWEVVKYEFRPITEYERDQYQLLSYSPAGSHPL